MTGHVRQRGNSFELKFEIAADPATGKRRIRYATIKTKSKREAQKELARLVAEHEAGESVDPSRITVSEFLDRWERDWAKINTSAKTFERYSELLRKHVRPRIGQVQLQKLKVTDLNALYSALVTEPIVIVNKKAGNVKGLAARTVGHTHRVLRRALGHAQLWGLVRHNVAALVSPPRVEATEIQILSADQWKTMLKRLRGKPLYLIGATLLGTGMRRGELCGLRWKDLDLDGGKLRVEQSLEQTKAGLRFKSPKTKHGRRTITLAPSLVAELRAHWKAQQEERLRLGMGKAPADGLIFTRWDGEPHQPDRLTRQWTDAMRAIGVDATLHSLRHTHASHLIAQGVDVLSISRRLGHGSPTITLGVYGHLFADAQDRAAQIMELAFSAEAE
jgi:integrase